MSEPKDIKAAARELEEELSEVLSRPGVPVANASAEVARCVHLLGCMIADGTVVGFEWSWDGHSQLRAVSTIQPPGIEGTIELTISPADCDEPGEGG